MTRPAEQDTRSMLRRAFDLLDAFDVEHPELSVRELALRSGVARSTTHRLAAELVEWGALERTDDGLRLGGKLFELGTLVPGHTTIREAATPFLHTLHEVTHLTANLAVRERNQIVYLEKISSRSLRVPHTRMGGRGTLHATALGKAILAYSDADPDALTPTLTPVTPRTITTVRALRIELARVRAARVAYDEEESQTGLFCVAAPVLDRSGSAIAAISVTGATALAQAQRFAPTVMAIAASLGAALRPRR